MSVGVWDPSGKDQSKPVNSDLLEKLVMFAATVEDQVVAASLEEAGLADASWVMTTDAASWDAAAELDSDALRSLVRLFTLVEDQVSGWDAGKKSPVIPLVKQLKERGDFDAELRKWVKSHTKNRYLPYGSAL